MEQKRAFSLLVENTSSVLSRVAGFFTRRGYNIDSIAAGVTMDPRITRIKVVAHGDDLILEQIEKQLDVYKRQGMCAAAVRVCWPPEAAGQIM